MVSTHRPRRRASLTSASTAGRARPASPARCRAWPTLTRPPTSPPVSQSPRLQSVSQVLLRTLTVYDKTCSFSSKHPSANTCEVSKRSRLLSQLALPYSRFVSRTPSTRSRQKLRRVSPRPNGVESEQGSDASCDMTSDLTDVTSDITDVSSVPPSPRVLKNIEKGTLGNVVRGHEGRMLGSVLIPCALSFLLRPSFSSFPVTRNKLLTSLRFKPLYF